MTAACLLAGAALAAGGCGASPTASLSAGRAARWHDTISAIRAADAAADRPTALAALTRLSGYVDRDAQAGQLAAADVSALKAGIAQARRHLPQPAATAFAAPPPPPPDGDTPAQPSRTTGAPPPAASKSPATSNGVAQGKDNDANAPKDAGKPNEKDDAKPPRKQDKASQSATVVLPDDGSAQSGGTVTSGTRAEPRIVNVLRADDLKVAE